MTALEDHEQGLEPTSAEDGFDSLYRSTYGSMLALAVATVRNRALAEDLVQDAYAQLWVQRSSVARPVAWLRRAVVSNCLGSLRTQRRRDTIFRRQAHQPSAANTYDDETFLELLTGLNERQRIAVTLRYVEDLSESDIAAAMTCRPGTVKSMLSRARQILRARMEGEFR